MANKKENKNEVEKKNSTVKKTTTKKTETKVATKKTETKKTTEKKSNQNVKSATKKTTEKKEIIKKEPQKEKESVKKEEIKIKEISAPITAESNKDNKMIGIFEKIVILVAVALVFSLLGYFIGTNHDEQKSYSGSSDELQVFIEEYNKIVQEYYMDVDKESLIKGAISGMLSSLDSYSQVLDNTSNSFTINLEGQYEGLGIEIVNDKDGNIIIYKVYEDTPASRAGIKEEDIVNKFNDTEVKNISTTDLVNMIKQTENIKLELLRDEKEITVELKKENITLKSVSSEMLENSVGYIKVDVFANNTYEQFKEALENLENKKMKSLIIDLRDNSGGHLSTVKNMISLFLDSSHIIYQTESKFEKLEFYSTGNENKKYNIVILQNETSASASEIMASALSEQLGAYIIGKTSYGKGTVQQLETIEGYGQYKFTTKKWLTSKGVWIDGDGITPDLEVDLDKEYYENPTKENDTQLKEAIKYLKKK